MKFGLWTAICLAVMAMATVACAEAGSGAEDPAVAKIGDEVITESQLEAIAGTSLVALRQQIYDTKVAKLQEEIYRRLLQEAAAAEGVSEGDYVKARVDEAVGEPDPGEVVMLTSQYRAQLSEDDLEARNQVVQALKQRDRQRLAEELRATLFAEAGVTILLEPPRVEFTVAAGTPSRGPDDAAVVLIEYTDFQCPFCTRVQPTITELMRRYDGNLRHVFKNLPLPMHAEAPLAGAAALCAQDQGKFWELHGWLFENQRTLSRASIVTKAGLLGMDNEAFEACINDGKYQGRVRAEMVEANGYGITGTPGFLINGRVLTGAQPIEAFVEIIDDELARKGISTEPAQTAN